MNELRKNLLGILSTRASVAFVAKRIITDEDLVALYCSGTSDTVIRVANVVADHDNLLTKLRPI